MKLRIQNRWIEVVRKGRKGVTAKDCHAGFCDSCICRWHLLLGWIIPEVLP